MKLYLVYQAGIANVFRVEKMSPAAVHRGKTRRLLQSDFRTCVAFTRGAIACGARVLTAACNQAGDIAQSDWTYDLDAQPFSDQLVDLTA